MERTERKPWMRLTQLREARGMSKYRLSKTSGVSQVYIGELESGSKSPTLITVEKLAIGLGVSSKDLVGEKVG